MIRIGCMLLGILGTIWFLIPLITSFVINIGNITGICVFVLLFFIAWKNNEFLQITQHINQSVLGKIFLRFICVILVLIFSTACVLSVKMIKASRQTADTDSGTLIVLGCGVYGERPSLMLIERMQAALHYMQSHPDTVCILSGGQGEGEDITEAEAMFRWLTNAGISSDRLFLEDASTSTRENIQFSKKIIEANSLDDTVLLVTNEFHTYRAGRIAEKAGLSYHVVPAKTAWWLFPTFAVREMYGILYERFIR